MLLPSSLCAHGLPGLKPRRPSDHSSSGREWGQNEPWCSLLACGRAGGGKAFPGQSDPTHLHKQTGARVHNARERTYSRWAVCALQVLEHALGTGVSTGQWRHKGVLKVRLRGHA